MVTGARGTTLAVDTGPVVSCSAIGVKVSGLTLLSKGGEACVTVAREGALTLEECEVQNAGGDGVQVYGECLLAACKVLQCASYGTTALAGGSVTINASTITLNTKTGVLSRGKGSRMLLTAGTLVSKNKMHGIGADQGASFSASATSVRENGYVGVNAGDGASGLLVDCTIDDNGMHGIQCTGGDIKVSKCSVTKARKLGIFVNPPAALALMKQQQRARVELDQVQVTSCGFFGVHITGGALSARDCDITRSGDSGLVAKGGILSLTNSTISANGSFGVSLSDQRDAHGAVLCGARGELVGCQIHGNTGLGVHCSGASECTLKACKVLDTKLPSPPIEAGGSGVAAVLGGLVAISRCKIAGNATYGIFVNGGHILKDGTKRNASGVSVVASQVVSNGSYGASVSQATPDMPVAANLRIGAFGCDFSKNAHGEIEGVFSKDLPVALYLGLGLGVAALGYYVLRIRSAH